MVLEQRYTYNAIPIIGAFVMFGVIVMFGAIATNCLQRPLIF